LAISSRVVGVGSARRRFATREALATVSWCVLAMMLALRALALRALRAFEARGGGVVMVVANVVQVA
jgi:hypothetical protein